MHTCAHICTCVRASDACFSPTAGNLSEAGTTPVLITRESPMARMGSSFKGLFLLQVLRKHPPLLGGRGEHWPCGIRFPVFGSRTARTRGKIQEVITSQTTRTPRGMRGRARGPGDLAAVQLSPGKWGPHAPGLRAVPTGFRDTAFLLRFF